VEENETSEVSMSKRVLWLELLPNLAQHVMRKSSLALITEDCRL
jgi:hypothetical protein